MDTNHPPAACASCNLVPPSHSTPRVERPALGGFDEAEKVALVRHLNVTLAADRDVASILQLEPHGEAYFKAACDGVLLAKLVGQVDANALDCRALNVPNEQPLSAAAALQNAELCLTAAAAIGAGVSGLTAEQLRAAPTHRPQALELLWGSLLTLASAAATHPVMAAHAPSGA